MKLKKIQQQTRETAFTELDTQVHAAKPWTEQRRLRTLWSGNMKAQNALIQVSFIKMETGKITRVSNVEREGMREIRVQKARLSPRFALS